MHRLLLGDGLGAGGEAGPKARAIRLWRAHPEVVFAFCAAFLIYGDLSSVTTRDWVSWTDQELTLQRIPDPVLPYTLAATVTTAIFLTWILTPRVGAIRAALVGISTPVAAVGSFELAFLFILYPSAFWIPAHLDLTYWGYAIAILSYAMFGFVGGGWWKIPRWWWLFLVAVVVGFAIWYAAGVPLPVSEIGGHHTPPDLLGVALAGNVALKWAVFVLFAAPIALGARRASDLQRASAHGASKASIPERFADPTQRPT